jgi:hypothetical protein
METPSLVTSDSARGAIATIDAWRARGDHRLDPVRFRFIEVLARRAESQQGEVRRILDDRIATLLAAYGEKLERVRGTEGSEGPKQGGPLHRGALAELVDHIAGQAPSLGDGAAASDAAPSGELKTLRYFRSTWSRLSADRWLTQSLAKMPANAGPLHSHHLVHRSLTLMHELSPEYLNRLMAYVDVLSWVEQLNSASAPAHANAPRAETSRKSARGKGG